MERELTIDDLTQWILANRRGKAFLNWTAEDIKRTFSKAFGSKLAAYTVNKHGEICGIVYIEPTDTPNTMFCNTILTTEKGALQALWTKFGEWWSGYKLIARRRGKYTSYNTERLHKKLCTIIH